MEVLILNITLVAKRNEEMKLIHIGGHKYTRTIVWGFTICRGDGETGEQVVHRTKSWSWLNWLLRPIKLNWNFYTLARGPIMSLSVIRILRWASS